MAPIPMTAHPHKEEVPPSGMCAYQINMGRGVWKCLTEEEYLQRKANEKVMQDACIASRPMPAYPNLTDGLGVILIFGMLFAFLYCTKTQNWGRGLLAMALMIGVMIFLKPFC